MRRCNRYIIKELFWEAGGGILIGASLGYVTAILMATQRWAYSAATCLFNCARRYYYLLVADQLHASGFMAVFTCGVIVGNKEFFRLPLDHHEHEYLEDYMGNTALLMRMFILFCSAPKVDFTLLGQYLWVGVALLVIFMCVAPPSPYCSAPPRTGAPNGAGRN